MSQRYPCAEVVILGDFNAHHTEWLSSRTTDYAGRTVYNFAHAYGFSQLVSDFTRIPDIEDHTRSMLDLLLTTRPEGYLVTVNAPLGSSDHCLVHSEVPLVHTGRSRPPGSRRVWHYKSADWDGLRLFYASYPVSFVSLRKILRSAQTPSRILFIREWNVLFPALLSVSVVGRGLGSILPAKEPLAPSRKVIAPGLQLLLRRIHWHPT